jgi:hypothetical protein
MKYGIEPTMHVNIHPRTLIAIPSWDFSSSVFSTKICGNTPTIVHKIALYSKGVIEVSLKKMEIAAEIYISSALNNNTKPKYFAITLILISIDFLNAVIFR